VWGVAGVAGGGGGGKLPLKDNRKTRKFVRCYMRMPAVSSPGCALTTTVDCNQRGFSLPSPRSQRSQAMVEAMQWLLTAQLCARNGAASEMYGSRENHVLQQVAVVIARNRRASRAERGVPRARVRMGWMCAQQPAVPIRRRAAQTHRALRVSRGADLSSSSLDRLIMMSCCEILARNTRCVASGWLLWFVRLGNPTTPVVGGASLCGCKGAFAARSGDALLSTQPSLPSGWLATKKRRLGFWSLPVSGWD
jgi:hypothetical protein